MKNENYVDNKEFLKAMIKYRKEVNKARRLKLPKPQVPRYVAQCIMKIAENFSHNYKFLSYTFRDEMVADAIENCIRYIDNFDHRKSKNPFAYFSQIAYYAYLRRIQREKKELYVKYKSTEIAGVIDEYELNENEEEGVFRQFELYENISEFIQKYEDSMKKKKEKKAAGLEKFVEEEEK